MPELLSVQCIPDTCQSQITWPKDVSERIHLSRSLAEWAPGLKQLCSRAIHRIATAPAHSRPHLKAVSKDELAQWKRHIYNGHEPYRRDCAVCVQARGRDKQHRRIKAPEP